MFLGGGLKHFLFIPLPGEMINIYYNFSKGFKSPTRFFSRKSDLEGAPHFRLNSGVGRCALAFIPKICWKNWKKSIKKPTGFWSLLFFTKVGTGSIKCPV